MRQYTNNTEKTSLSELNCTTPTRDEIIQSLSEYTQPDWQKASLQLVNTLGPYLGLWALMILTVVYSISYWLTLALSVFAAGFLVRIFILFHDCCHSAFLPSRLANRIVGYIAGTLTFTAYEDWQRAHITHHANSGNLDRRGDGDVWTLTVEEYLASSKLKRMAYRCFRNPFVLFSIMPLVLFLVVHRFPSVGARQHERNSVLITNAAIAGMVAVMSLTLGFQNFLLIQLPVIALAASTGVWLFYIQHQYEEAYWSRQHGWDLTHSALKGSSYYQLPKVFQWLVGNIGLHHIHHLKANIPNYNLQRCFNEVAVMQTVTPITLRASLKSLRLNLWDEQKQKLVSFKSIRKLPRANGKS
jgi:omega-6 fatty acid desaturase (delta-12 desaturase)